MSPSPKNFARVFSVEEYDAYSGWDVIAKRVGRRAAWDACQTAEPVRVFEHFPNGGGRPVYEAGSVADADHTAWIGRCSR